MLKKTAGALLILLLILLFTIGMIVLLYWQTEWVSQTAQSYINSSFENGEIEYSSVKGSLINQIIVEDFNLSLKAGTSVKVNEINLTYALLPLLNEELVVHTVFLDSVFINLSPPIEEKLNVPSKQPEFNLDSILLTIQNSTILDSILAKLPNAVIEDIQIKAGAMVLAKPQMTLQDIHIAGSVRTSPERVDFKLDHFSFSWPEKRINLDRLHFNLLVKNKQLTVNNFLLQSGTSKAVFSADLSIPTLNLLLFLEEFKFNAKDFSALLPPEMETAQTHANIEFIGKPTDFALNGEVKANWKHHKNMQLKLRSAYKKGKIDVDTLAINNAGAHLFLQAGIDPKGSAEGVLHLRNINTKAILPVLDSSNINSDLQFNFPIGAFDINKLDRTFKNITGYGKIKLHKSYYGQFNMDSLQFSLTAQNGAFNIEQPSFAQFANQARFDIYGSLDRSREMDFQIHTSLGDLNDLTAALGIDSLYGSYYADLRAFGKINNPEIEGHFEIKDLAYPQITMDSVGLDIGVKDIQKGMNGFADFKINKGSVYNTPVNDIILNGRILENIIHLDAVKAFSNENYIETVLDIHMVPDSITVNMHKLRMEYEKYWLQNKEPIRVVYDTSAVQLKNFNLSGRQNALLKVDGRYGFAANTLQTRMDLNNVFLEPFQQFLGSGHTMNGVLNGHAQINQTLENPKIVLDMTGEGIVYNNVKIGDFKTDFYYDNKNLKVRELYLKADSTLVTLEGDFTYNPSESATQLVDYIRQTKSNLKLNWKNVDLLRYTPLLNSKTDLAGHIDGYLELEGTIDDPYIRQALQLRDFKYDAIVVDSLNMFGQYSSGYIMLDSLSADVNNTAFSLKGYQELDLSFAATDTFYADNAFEFYFYSKDDNISFVKHFNEQLESIHGDYEIELFLSGSPQKPGIDEGKITLNNGKMLLSRVKDPIEDVQIDISIEENILTFNNVRAKSQREMDIWQKGFHYLSKLWSWALPKEKEKGLLTVGGTIDLQNVLRPDIDMGIEMNQFYVNYFVESARVGLSTENFRIKGQDTLNVTGFMRIPFGEKEVNISQMQKNMYLSKPTKEIGKPYLAMQLDIEMPGNFIVTSSAFDFQNNFKISLQGNLQIAKPPLSDNMSILGTFETESGKFSSFNQNFNVTAGSINLSNPIKMNPDLNIVASKRVGTMKFELNILGNLEAIRQEITVLNDKNEVQNLTDQEKITMLTLGTDISAADGGTNNALRGVGEDIATNMALTAAERGLEEVSGLDKVEISSNNKLLDLQKLKLNNGLKQASISFGKYLTSDLYVEYRTQFGSGVPTPKLSWDAGNRISLQYKINQRWSLDSFYEKTVPYGRDKVQLGLTWEYSF